MARRFFESVDNTIIEVRKKVNFMQEEQMRNKIANFLIAIIGVALFSFARWFADKSIYIYADSYLLVSGIILIIGAILVLFAIINFTSIIFANSFEENKTQTNQIAFPRGKKFQ